MDGGTDRGTGVKLNALTPFFKWQGHININMNARMDGQTDRGKT